MSSGEVAVFRAEGEAGGDLAADSLEKMTVVFEVTASRNPLADHTS